MSYSIVQICNEAISKVGSGSFIDSLEDDSVEAEVCKLHYDNMRQAVLRDFAWPFATVSYFALSLIAEDPNDHWSYSYQIPTDCLFFRFLHNPNTRIDLPEYRIPYRIVKHPTNSSRIIFTNLEDATAEYTNDFDEAEFFPTDFGNALSWRLGAAVAPRLARTSAPEAAKNCMQMYLREIAIAQNNAANEDNGDEEQNNQESEFIRARS